MPHTANNWPFCTWLIYSENIQGGQKQPKTVKISQKWTKPVKNCQNRQNWTITVNVRHGAKNARHGAKNERHSTRNVRHGAKKVRHGAQH